MLFYRNLAAGAVAYLLSVNLSAVAQTPPNLYPIKENGLWGLINQQGKTIVPPEFDAIGQFWQGKAVVTKQGLSGLIDTNGKILIAAKYQEIVRRPDWRWALKDGGVWGLAAANTALVSPPKFSVIAEFRLGFAAVQQNGKWGLMDTTGKIALKTDYDGVRLINAKKALIRSKAGWGFADLKTGAILPPEYDEVETTAQMGTVVKKAAGYGWVDDEAVLRVPAQFDRVVVTNYSKNYQIAVKSGGKWGFYAPDGRPITPIEYDSAYVVSRYFLESISSNQIIRREFAYLFVVKNNKLGAFNLKGNLIVPAEHDSIEVKDFGYLSAINGITQTIFDPKGKKIVTGKYELVYLCKYGLISVSQQNKLGIIDTNGTEILPPEFSSIGVVSSKLLYVFKNQQYRYCFHDGSLVFSGSVEWESDISYGHIIVKQTDQFYGLADTNGKWVLPPENKYIRFDAYNVVLVIKDSVSQYIAVEDLGKENPDNVLRVKKEREESYDPRTRPNNVTNIIVTPDSIRYQWIKAPFFNRDGYGWSLVNKAKYARYSNWSENGNMGRIMADRVRPYYKNGYLSLVIKLNDGLGKTTTGLTNDSLGKYILQPTFPKGAFDPADFDSSNVMRLVEAENTYNAADSGFVYKTPKYSLVGRDGRIRKLDYQITAIGRFSNGLAKFCFGGTPKVVFDRNDDAGHPLYKVADYGAGKWGLMDKNGRIVLKATFDDLGDAHFGVIKAKKAGKWGLINPKGEWIMPAQYDNIEYVAGLPYVRIDKKTNAFLLIDQKGKALTDALFEATGEMAEGLIAVKIKGKWGYANARGAVVIPPQFEAAKSFSEGFALVKLKNKWGYIQKDGAFAVQPIYSRAKPFAQGRAAVSTNGALWGYINRKGEWTVEPKLSFAESYSPEKLALAADGGLYGLLDSTGKWQIPAKYSRMSAIKDGFVTVQDKDKAYLMRLNGEKVNKQGYSQVFPLSNGLIRVRERGFYGYMDTTGQLRVAPKVYVQATDFVGGLARVRARGTGFSVYIDSTGTPRPSGSYLDRIRFDRSGAVSEGMVLLCADQYLFVQASAWQIMGDNYSLARSFANGRAAVKPDSFKVDGRWLKRKWGFIDQKGVMIVPAIYDEVSDFDANGLARVKLNGVWGVIDLNGAAVVLPKYVEIGVSSEGVAPAKRQFESGLASVKGEILIERGLFSVKSTNGLAQVETKDRIGYADGKGGWVYAVTSAP